MKKIALKVLFKLKLADYFNLEVNAGATRIPIIGGIGYGNIFGSEKWMRTVLELLLKGFRGCFVDVGVNVGQTLIKVKSIDREIEYIGFEPNPICVFYTERLIAANQFPHTRIIPAGVSNNNEIVTLKYFGADAVDSAASIIDNFRPGEKVMQEKQVVVVSGALVKIDQKIGVVKIDVEGAELFVIEGLRSFLERDRPAVVMEILPVYTAENRDRLTRQETLLGIFREIGYQAHRILKNTDDTLKGIVPIDDIGIHGDVVHSDYIFVPREAADRIR